MMLTRSCLAALCFAFLLSVSAPYEASGQSLGTIQISEPSAWATSTPRGLTVVERSSVKITGFVDHPSGVQAVYLNGQKAALQLETGTRGRFTGFADVQQGFSEVIIELEPVAGGAISRSFPLVVRPAQPGLSPRQRAESGGERWAVVIGISDYQDPAITDLEYADDDAQAVYDFLRSQAAGLGGFKEENILLLINEEATYAAIRNALFTFLKRPTDEDVVVVYFAGHGTPDPDRLQNHYLLTYDTQLDDISSTAFPMDDVQAAINQTFYNHFILLADACHSAGMAGGASARDLGMNSINQIFLERLEASSGGYVSLTASQVNQLSREDSRWGGGHGVFTHFLLEALEGAADEDGDQIVTLGETMEYVRNRVRRETRNSQIPSISPTAFDRYLPFAAVSTPEPEAANPIPEPEPADPTPEVDPGEAEGVALTRSLFNPTQAAVKSFFVPGLGQASTGRKGPGLGFITGFAGALGIGLMITATDIVCASPNPQTCPAEDILSEVRSRPYMDISVGAALAISVIAAWDAHRGAKRANERVRSLSEASSPGVLVGPRITGSPGGQMSIEWLRVRF